jgi:Co/Zn/Cd efflux system component
MQVGIPTFSVITLLAVSAWIAKDAVVILLRPVDVSQTVNPIFLFGYSSANALVDLICGILFYLRKKDVLKMKALDDVHTGQHNHHTNVNMASALTHVGGDILRTISVFVAALVGVTTNISTTKTDAWAAIIVTITILFLVAPLIGEIIKDFRRLKNIKDEDNYQETANTKFNRQITGKDFDIF